MKSEKEYQLVYKDVVSGKKPEDLPRNYPAHWFKEKWHAIVIDPEVLNLTTFHGRTMIPYFTGTKILDLLHILNIVEIKM